jgi:trehalose 6-phosphate synthase/phosphatase
MAQNSVIIVSNRLPVSVKKENGELVFSPSLGGLATGLSSYFNANKDTLWIGWPGIASDGLTDREKQVISDNLIEQNLVPVFLTQKQIDEFYNGFSNSLLWPVFHGLRIRKHSAEEVKSWWQAYKAVNKKFLEAVISESSAKSQVWVHDYQLILLPEMIRKEKPESSVGFFLHIPFPLATQLDKLPQAKSLLKGLLGSDLIGFHTDGYVTNFVDCTKYWYMGDHIGDTINYNSRYIRVAQFPMGIDYEKFAAASKLRLVRDLANKYERKYRNLKVIASVDRLDPSKGLAERLRAYDKFLEDYPKHRGKVTFVMVAAPSRTNIVEYKDLAKRLDRLAFEINLKYSTRKWRPLEYINKPIPFEHVNALFKIADIAFITPIKDGMNLTAKEFIASNKRNGVLILSNTAGAADELNDAIIVNPKSQAELSHALEEAMHMNKKELQSRLKRMRSIISTNTVESWAKSFVDALDQPLPGTPHITRALNTKNANRLTHAYAQAKKRLIMLDYDGTLVPFSREYKDVDPPGKVYKLLEKLSNDPKNEVVLISGRGSSDLDKWFGSLKINLVAEHGASIRTKNAKWQTIDVIDSSWKKTIIPILEKYAEQVPGATVEVKPHSLVWHYRETSPYLSQKYSVILKRVVKPMLKKSKLDILQGNKIIEIKNPSINKGSAALRWLKHPYDFIFFTGDDATDEELFAVLPLTAYSVKVGRGLTKALFRVPNYRAILRLIEAMT